MSLKRKLIIFGFSSLLGILVLVLTLGYLYFYIPTYIESQLLPEIARKIGITDYACDVRRIDFSGADLGSLRIGDSKKPALSIDAVQIDFSPAGLYRKEIDRVALNGIELFCEYKNGEFTLRQFDLKTVLARLQSSSKTAPSSENAPPPLPVKRLEIKNALIVFEWNGERLRLPVELEIVPEKKDTTMPYPSKFDCMLRLYPRGQEIVFASTIHLQNKTIFLGFDANAVYLERFSDFAKLIPGLTLSGEADLKGKASFQYQPFKISSASAICQFQTADVLYENLRLKYSHSPQKENEPFRIEISMKDGNEWRFSASSASSISTVSPMPMLISGINCDFKFLEDAAAGSGNFNVSIQPFNPGQTSPVEVLEPLDLKGIYFVEREKDGQWNFRIKNTGPEKSSAAAKNCKFRIKDFDIFVGPAIFDINGNSVNSKVSATYKVVAPRVNVATASTVIQTPLLSLNGKAEFSHSGKYLEISSSYKVIASDVKTTAKSGTVQIPAISLNGNGSFSHSQEYFEVSTTYKFEASDVKATAESWTLQIPAISLNGNGGFDTSVKRGMKFATYELKASDTGLTGPSANMNIPGASLIGKVSEGKDQALNFDGLFKIDDMGITLSEPKSTIAGIHGIVPLKWPPNGAGENGTFSIKAFEWEGRDLGSVTGAVQQKESGLIFKGVYNSSLLPDLSMDFTGNTGILHPQGYETGIHFEVNNYTTPSDVDLGQFLPKAKGVTFNGELGLNGDLTFNSAGLKSTLNAILNNANLMLKEKKASIEGIQAALSFTDLSKMRSAPKQELRFEKASLGEINASNGKIEFQIESPKSLFIEKSSFSWCDGNVQTQAMRIYPGIDDYDLILYCDRLKLAKILAQFGAVNAKGNGTVNGKLPIRVQNGKIRFNDGFLYSTPGEGGTVRITGTEILTSGVPPDTPQFAQIELAREALKDYDYNWTKLNIVSEGENVLMRLQFDGKPAQPLPFVYNKEIGGFVKVEAGGKGSFFQGIGLDVNFRVPLDNILSYKDIFNMIQ